MEHLLQTLGIKPIKLFRLMLALVVFISLAAGVFYFFSPSAQYGVAIISNNQQLQKVNFKSCLSESTSDCLEKIIAKNKVNEIGSASVLINKLEKFYESHKNKVKEEEALVSLNKSVNVLLAGIDLKKHFVLSKINPLWGIFKKEFCIIQSGEKDIERSSLSKIADKSASERQRTYEKFPTHQELIHIFVKRQEIINKLYVEIEEAFPKDQLGKCAKAYALHLKNAKLSAP